VAATDETSMRVPLSDLGTVLGVWAHPDDEAFLSAGVMAQVREHGRRVVVATATYGELGDTEAYPYDPDRLAAVRRHELAASLAAVGVSEHRWLGYRDGGCAGVDADLAAGAVERIIDEVQPDTILTFGPDGMTGHPDHQAVSAWTTAAWRSTGARARLLYATLTAKERGQWEDVHERFGGVWMSGTGPCTEDDAVAIRLELTGYALDRKMVALRAQASQTTGLLQALGAEAFATLCAVESFVAARPSDGAR
jgi:LmbE family N-acetylglucosaminyl deacetylase